MNMELQGVARLGPKPRLAIGLGVLGIALIVIATVSGGFSMAFMGAGLVATLAAGVVSFTIRVPSASRQRLTIATMLAVGSVLR